MIIKNINIDGFGVFNDFSLDELDEGVNVIMGDNEAGKSTLLKFLRFTLFGYPTRKYKRMYPLNGGEHGGRITGNISSEQEVVFERYEGASGGDIKLYYDGKESENKNQWYQFLGNADKELYKNVYAFSLDELNSLESLSESGVEDKIFSVGLGLGDTSIGEIESDITERNEEIYKQRGSVQKIPETLDKIQKQKEKISKIEDNLPYYEKLTSEIESIEAEVEKLDEKLKYNRAEKSKLEKSLQCYEHYVKINKIKEKLDELPEAKDYPENGISQLDKLEEKQQEYKEKLQELKTGTQEDIGIEELQKKIDEIEYSKKLLEQKDKIEYIKKNIEKYKQTKQDIKDDEQKIKNIDSQIRQELIKIGNDWAEEEANSFSDIELHKSKIKEFSDKLDSLKEEKRDIKADLNAIRKQQSSVDGKNIALATSVIFVIASAGAFYYSLPVLGAILFATAAVIFGGRSYFFKQDLESKYQEQLQQLEEQQQNTRQDYENYLQKLNLSGSLSAEAVFDIFRNIQQVKQIINEKEQIKQKQEVQRKPFVDEFESVVQELADDKEEIDNIEIFVNKTLSDFETSQKKKQKKEDLEKQLQRRERELQTTESKLENVEKQIKQLLDSTDVEKTQEFRKKYKQNEQVKQLQEEKSRAVETIENIIGTGKVEKIIGFLDDKDKQGIESRIVELENKIEEKEQELKQKNSQLGEKKNERETIAGESEMAEIKTELETQKQKLRNHYKNWLKGKVALKVLSNVREKYEQEKQPEVIKKSSKYFSKITEDKYERINVSLDDKEVTVFDSSGKTKKIAELSRGTKEQLLISLRLGFIDEYETESEPLPVVMDDVFVNFDPTRANRTAQVVQEFSQGRQVLIFTCHPSTLDHFEGGVNLVELGG